MKNDEKWWKSYTVMRREAFPNARQWQKDHSCTSSHIPLIEVPTKWFLGTAQSLNQTGTWHDYQSDIQWIGLRENLNRKPWFLPSNIGLSCKFSHHPILWYIDSMSMSSPQSAEGNAEGNPPWTLPRCPRSTATVKGSSSLLFVPQTRCCRSRDSRDHLARSIYHSMVWL